MASKRLSTGHRAYLILSGSIFFLVALLHLLRLLFDWPIVFGSWAVPYWASYLGFPVASGYCAWAWWLSWK